MNKEKGLPERQPSKKFSLMKETIDQTVFTVDDFVKF